MRGDIHAWTRADLQAMIDAGGKSYSAYAGGDSDADKSDPRCEFRKLHKSSSIPALSLSNNGLTKEHTRAIRYMVLSMYALACETKHNTKLIIFGRDMYPFLAMRETVGHKLRGHWHYAEGLSRQVINSFRGAYADYDIGIDTGFSGTIPMTAMNNRGNKGIRLMSSDYTNRQILPYGDETTELAAYIREAVIELEHMPKPFLRCNEIETQNGLPYPVMRIAAKADCIYAARVWDYTCAMAHHYLPAFRVMLDMENADARLAYILQRLPYLLPKMTC